MVRSLGSGALMVVDEGWEKAWDRGFGLFKYNALERLRVGWESQPSAPAFHVKVNGGAGLRHGLSSLEGARRCCRQVGQDPTECASFKGRLQGRKWPLPAAKGHHDVTPGESAEASLAFGVRISVPTVHVSPRLPRL